MPSSIIQPLDDESVSLEVARQIGRPMEVEKIHISRVRAADTVFHEGKVKTVCPKDLKRDSFMGRTMFGDSYVLGRKPVLRVIMAGAPTS